MSVEINQFSFVMVAVPLLAAALGFYVAIRRGDNALWRWGGIGLAVLGPAQIVGMLLWFERGCFETWRPCGTAYGMAIWLLWLGLAVVLALASVRYVAGVMARN